MPRPAVFIFLMLTFMVTSQFEWRRRLVDDLDQSPSAAVNQHQPVTEEDVAREKMILLQERSIHQLSQLARSLRQQLLQCRAANDSSAYGEQPVEKPSSVNGDAVPEDIILY